MVKRILARACIGWLYIVGLAWWLADQRIALCSPDYISGPTRGPCLVQATAARDLVLTVGLTVALVAAIVAAAAGSVIRARNGDRHISILPRSSPPGGERPMNWAGKSITAAKRYLPRTLDSKLFWMALMAFVVVGIGLLTQRSAALADKHSDYENIQQNLESQAANLDAAAAAAEASGTVPSTDGSSEEDTTSAYVDEAPFADADAKPGAEPAADEPTHE